MRCRRTAGDGGMGDTISVAVRGRAAGSPMAYRNPPSLRRRAAQAQETASRHAALRGCPRCFWHAMQSVAPAKNRREYSAMRWLTRLLQAPQRRGMSAGLAGIAGWAALALSACGAASAGAATELGTLAGVAPGASTMLGVGVGPDVAGSGIGVPVVSACSPAAGATDPTRTVDVPPEGGSPPWMTASGLTGARVSSGTATSKGIGGGKALYRAMASGEPSHSIRKR
jgi:hypothetical protein